MYLTTRDRGDASWDLGIAQKQVLIGGNGLNSNRNGRQTGFRKVNLVLILSIDFRR